MGGKVEPASRKERFSIERILVMGATGSGKTTLINGMINYIFNVQWEDTFRFQLIQEQTAGRSQVDSQTSRITAYDINHAVAGHDRRLPPTFCSILILATSIHLASFLLMLLHYFSCFTDELDHFSSRFRPL
jgi:energy-coupling factor transporter ATP-binding protein EcfA2